MAFKPISQKQVIEAVASSEKALGKPCAFYVLGYLGLVGTKAGDELSRAIGASIDEFSGY